MNLRCAQCGGSIPLERDEPFIRCPFCESHLYLDRGASVHHMALQASVSETRARDLLRDEARRREFALPQKLAVEGLLLPFWSVRGEGLQETIPAFSPCPFPLASYRLPAAQAAWFDPGRFPGLKVVEPAEAQPMFSAEAAIALYSVPFFKISWGAAPNAFEAFVEASEGRVFLGLCPPGRSGEISRSFLKGIGGLLLLSSAEAFLLPGFETAAIAASLTGVAAYFFYFKPRIGGVDEPR